MSAYIYKIVNKQSGKFYIGSTVDPVRRWSEHKGQLEKNTHINKQLQKDFNDLGIDYFEFIIVKKISKEYKDNIEEKLIAEYLNTELCYNENPTNKFPHKKNKVYLYDIDTLEELDSFDSYEDTARELGTSAGHISDYIWDEKIVTYKDKQYKIGTTPNKFISVENQILNKNCKIFGYNIYTKNLEIIYDTPSDFLNKTTKKDWRSLLTKYILTNYIYYFETENQPTKSMLNDRNTKIARYDKFGRLLQIFDKKQFSKENKENWEKIRGVARKNSRVLLSNGKANFNSTFDGFIYLFGETFDNIIKVHLVEISKGEEVYYFTNKLSCAYFIGVTNTSIVYAIKTQGKSKGYSIKEVLATECDVSTLPEIEYLIKLEQK